MSALPPGSPRMTTPRAIGPFTLLRKFCRTPALVFTDDERRRVALFGWRNRSPGTCPRGGSGRFTRVEDLPVARPLLQQVIGDHEDRVRHGDRGPLLPPTPRDPSELPRQVRTL